MKPAGKGVFRRWLRRLIILMVTVLLALVLVVGYANFTAIWGSWGRLFDEVSAVPETRVGLVFGTTDRVNGRENLYFRYRIDAAVRVWKAGKLKTLIVSGDNRSQYYNEPEKMRQALVERGIPGEPDRL